MAIFPKRVVQRILSENAAFLTQKQIQEHVRKLNDGNPQEKIAAEWEVFVLNTFHRHGHVLHEENLGGSARLDLSFRSDKSTPPEFVADIRTVSDEGLHQENPIDDLKIRLYQCLKKTGAKGVLHIDVHAQSQIPKLGEKFRLPLPLRAELDRFIKEEFKGFFDKIAFEPGRHLTIDIRRDDVALTVSFEPNAQFAYMSAPSYTVAYDKVQNPVFRALNEKAKQLRRSDYNGPKGIILCDGSCNLLRLRTYRDSGFSLSDVITYFFTSTTSVSFVLVLTAILGHSSRASEGPSRVADRLFLNPRAKYPLSDRNEIVARNIGQGFPIPIQDATNAWHWLNGKSKHAGLSFGGGFQMRYPEIKISARSLVYLLAGKPEPGSLDNEESAVGELHPEVERFFKQRLGQGSTIRAIHVEPQPDFDDDWVVITFGPPDPALCPYVVPNDVAPRC